MLRLFALGVMVTSILFLVGNPLSENGEVRSSLSMDPASAVVVTSQIVLGSLKDNTLYQDNEGDLSNGAGEHFFAGMTDDAEIRRGIIAFDVPGNIPANSTVVSATLQLHMSRTIVGPQMVNLHRVLKDWGEGSSDAPGGEGEGADASYPDVTWVHTRFGIDFWDAHGGDYASSASASASVEGVGDYIWSSPQMTADIQAWLDSPNTNFGWMLLGNENASPTAKRFDTKENLTEANHPVLMVEFIQPDATATPTSTATATPTGTATLTATPTVTEMPEPTNTPEYQTFLPAVSR